MIPMNQESLVGAGHQPASITSLPFVHTARRYYRLNDLVRTPDAGRLGGREFPRHARRKLFKLDPLEEVKVVTRFP